MRASSVLGPCAAFLQWWRAELLAMLPAPLQRAAGPRRILDLRGDRPAVAGASRGGWRPLETLDSLETGGAALRPLAREDLVVIAVPPDWMLRRVLRLPDAAERRLDDVLRFEVEQHIPFAADDVLWSARLLRRLPEAQRIEVELTVLPRHLVAHAVSALRRAGVRAPLTARAEAGGEWRDVALDTLAPVTARRWRGVAEASLACAAAVLAGHLVLSDLEGREAAAAAVEARAAEARLAAETTHALEREAAALRARLALAAEMRGGRPPAVAVLEEVARRLPDDAWLVEFRLTGDQLTLAGFAGRSEGLLGTLDASRLFREVRFAAPVTRGPRDTADRIQLALRVAPPSAEPQPQPRRIVQR